MKHVTELTCLGIGVEVDYRWDAGVLVITSVRNADTREFLLPSKESKLTYQDIETLAEDIRMDDRAFASHMQESKWGDR